MNQQIQIAIISLVGTILSALAAFSIKLIDIKSEEIKERTNNKNIEKYIDLGKEIIETTVISIDQTFVEPLKRAKKFDEIKAKEAFAKCRLQILAMLTEPIKKAILSVSKDVESFIDTNIEACVKKNKELFKEKEA